MKRVKKIYVYFVNGESLEIQFKQTGIEKRQRNIQILEQSLIIYVKKKLGCINVTPLKVDEKHKRFFVLREISTSACLNMLLSMPQKYC